VVLVLDDVGAAQSKEGEVERKLFTRVIGARYNARKPTVITANLTRTQLEAAMGERAFDRIQHACEWVVFDGPSERGEAERSRAEGTLSRIRQAAGVGG
jgi:DNA replication protein DnaC